MLSGQTNYTDVHFFTWSVIGKQNNTVNFNSVFWGFSAVPVFRGVAVMWCSRVPGFSTCRIIEE